MRRLRGPVSSHASAPRSPPPPHSSRRALLPGPGHRPTAARANGNAAWAPPSSIGPMATRCGDRPDQARANSGVARYGPPSPRRIGGEAVTGSALLPSDPVSRFCLFLFQTTWTRGGLRGCPAAGGNPSRHRFCRRRHRGCDPAPV